MYLYKTTDYINLRPLDKKMDIEQSNILEPYIFAVGHMSFNIERNDIWNSLGVVFLYDGL